MLVVGKATNFICKSLMLFICILDNRSYLKLTIKLSMSNQKRENKMKKNKLTGIIMAAMSLFMVFNLELVAQKPITISPEMVIAAVDNVSPIIEKVSQDLWNYSELSLVELKSSDYLKGILKKNGFKLTSEGTAGVPTAFVSEFGSGKPVLGIFLEYDALPGLGNEAVPYKVQRKDSVTAGHACGHNLIGSGALGAAVAIKNLMK
ncbi:MAG: hypothetical protein K8R53_12255, partial [Bacteroidales bacterium]|nr:hypothetical protein [Bacteroidales bacterium]